MNSSSSTFSAENIKGVFINLADHGTMKLMSGVAIVPWMWLFGTHAELVVCVFSLVLLDTVTGAWKAAKLGQLSSKGFFRFATKLVVYLILMATGSIVDKTMPIEFSITIMGTFLAITESISVLENVAKLGFPVPTRLVRMLREQNELQDMSKQEDGLPPAPPSK